jgi:hypothetical protein
MTMESSRYVVKWRVVAAAGPLRPVDAHALCPGGARLSADLARSRSSSPSCAPHGRWNRRRRRRCGRRAASSDAETQSCANVRRLRISVRRSTPRRSPRARARASISTRGALFCRSAITSPQSRPYLHKPSTSAIHLPRISTIDASGRVTLASCPRLERRGIPLPRRVPPSDRTQRPCSARVSPRAPDTARGRAMRVYPDTRPRNRPAELPCARRPRNPRAPPTVSPPRLHPAPHRAAPSEPASPGDAFASDPLAL